MIVLIILGIGIGVVWITQLTAFTPAFKDVNGETIEGSIAELRQITLNGHKEWTSIRGEDATKPILLFLAGGPGGSQLAAVRMETAELEKNFVVVGWEQPGSGKSYRTMKRSEITPQTYIEDGYALTEYLCKEFKQEKIYLMGESWGSALGIFLCEQYPKMYHGFIGTGQMVAFLETEKVDYQFAMDMAKENQDEKMIQKLEKNGPPPYYGNDVSLKIATYINCVNVAMGRNPEIRNSSFHTMQYLGASEYGLLDKAYYLLGILNTFNDVYQQLYEIDLRTDYAKLEVPVYFFIGRHDINAPTYLAEDYFNVLQAPNKELVWFEHSGHSPWINEPSLFVEETLRVFGQTLNE